MKTNVQGKLKYRDRILLNRTTFRGRKNNQGRGGMGGGNRNRTSSRNNLFTQRL